MKKIEKLELKIYEYLGVLFFQKCVFILEKLIHFKDKGKNINYHIKNYNIDELENFKKFLYFNGFIHVRNTLILIVCTIIQALFLHPVFLIYLIPSLIKNIYCVMLQRYNYIRLNKVIELKKNQIQRRNLKIVKKIKESNKLQVIKQNDISVTLEQIQNLKKFIQGTDDVYLDRDSLNLLYLLKEFVECDKKENKDEKTYVLKGGR